ncbi:hypothetical protein V5799_021144 [Amblyomma americanum]|uniref:Uncharacterized protein n=1 Tax=Amblyomma americanum TaxID=6943 RepID=A0AAQ4FPD6_AMBAM
MEEKKAGNLTSGFVTGSEDCEKKTRKYRGWALFSNFLCSADRFGEFVLGTYTATVPLGVTRLRKRKGLPFPLVKPQAKQKKRFLLQDFWADWKLRPGSNLLKELKPYHLRIWVKSGR